ncbi:hypothetical protein B0T22DRAFT_55026 [Podospora appendiculata]|uniref:HMG box domain-containing protein n=1 Tax=Podospora appendiculata TaxID=314037 RepID=A0AAE0XIK3_9PEZI|nr:hypothetical protein B0T22DRAFT_55026 [Podospora appendiculata]
MTQRLEVIFGELGIVHYLDAFVDQGFDSWDTILDITESDLDALGVKLGHRRKLQRRIANSRGLAPDASLLPLTQPSVEDVKTVDLQKPEVVKIEVRETCSAVVAKRKYRRHPKPDENAPERPPSAYVLFSNKMREDLKGRNLTFTEIAKLVGENWQSLSAVEKEPFESQAQAVKDKYQNDLVEYKKTDAYKKYMAYLQEFKVKHAVQSQDKEVSKRVKLSDGGALSGSSANATPNRTSRSGSGSESHRGSEPPPNRQQRIGSAISVSDSQYSAVMTPGSYHTSLDESMNSPIASSMDRQSSDRSPVFSSPRDFPSLPGRLESGWNDDQRGVEHPSMQRHLPSLSDVFDGQGLLSSMPHANDANGFPFPRSNIANSPAPSSSLSNGDAPRPGFRTDQSSTGSSSSRSSFGYPRTPIEGPLPIHALLSSKPNHSFEAVQEQQPHQAAFLQHAPNGVGQPLTNDYRREHTASHASIVGHPAGYGYGAQPGPPPLGVPSQDRKPDVNLDGMSALLKAGEIVDRRDQ